MIDLDEIFLNILKIFLIEFKFIILYRINRITPGHLTFVFSKKKKYDLNMDLIPIPDFFGVWMHAWDEKRAQFIFTFIILDIVIWDPEATKTISSTTHTQSVDFNVFEGMTCHGLALTVLLGGKVVYENQVLQATQGAGKFIETAGFSDYVYKRVLIKDNVKKYIIILKNGSKTCMTKKNTFPYWKESISIGKNFTFSK